ncbi:MAG: RsmE family RNA methyltransferase [Kofleriaceae bacterium]
MRIFVAPSALHAGELAIRGDEHHYLARVRRARPGDALELVDGAGRRAAAVIERIGDAETVVVTGEPAEVEARPPRVHALVPLIKGDRMDSCLEKLVEVGADAIVVWPAARSVVRLDRDRREPRRAKYAAAVQAAARQSGRAQLPSIEIADDLAAAIAAIPASAARRVLDPMADDPLEVGDAAEVALASGPEGGLAPVELEQLARAGFAPVGLGPRVLRAETAPVVAVALIRAATRS